MVCANGGILLKRTLVISDIHGELELFEELLQTTGYNPNQDQLLYNNLLLEYIYEQLIGYLHKLGLEVESDKLKLMHFRRTRKGRPGCYRYRMRL